MGLLYLDHCRRAWENPDMEITPFVLGELQTNCYVVHSPKTGQAIVIDPADSGGTIIDFLVQHQLNLEVILLTHGHFDHVLGLLELVASFQVPVYLSPADQFLLKKAAQSAEHWLKHPVDPVPHQTVAYPDQLKLLGGELTLDILPTPGHTPGSVSLYNAATGQLFSGDTVFHQAVGRTDFAYASALKLADSLHRLRQLPPATQVLPGHGHDTTIQEISEWWQKTTE